MDSCYAITWQDQTHNYNVEVIILIADNSGFFSYPKAANTLYYFYGKHFKQYVFYQQNMDFNWNFHYILIVSFHPFLTVETTYIYIITKIVSNFNFTHTLYTTFNKHFIIFTSIIPITTLVFWCSKCHVPYFSVR